MTEENNDNDTVICTEQAASSSTPSSSSSHLCLFIKGASQIEVAVVFQFHGDFDGSKIQQS